MPRQMPTRSFHAILTICVVVLATVAIARVNAGSLTPPSSPSSTMVTLDDLNNSLQGDSPHNPTGYHGQIAITELEASSQGSIEGEDTVQGFQNAIEIFSFSHEVLKPYDQQTGQQTGTRQHRPVTIMKRIDKSSPLLMNVLVNNETVNILRLRLWRDDPGNPPEEYYRITLQNASVISIRHETVSTPGTSLPTVIEFVDIAYPIIDWEYVPTGASATDNWQTQP
ncbi:MAG: type VI secretion system tube protein TssD [Phycisphaerales bacterium JB043]